MPPQLQPEQHVFAEWLVHLVRARLHLVDALATAVARGPLSAQQQREVTSLRAAIGQLMTTLDEVLDQASDLGRPPM